MTKKHSGTISGVGVDISMSQENVETESRKPIRTREYSASYLALTDSEFTRRVEQAYDAMRGACHLCPRRCEANRLQGQEGACGADHRLFVSSSNLHLGEEPPISGTRGSGTIFLTHCNLSCSYCQNYPISQMGHGSQTSIDDLARMMVRLQRLGAHNINWVTPTHEVAHLLDGLRSARAWGVCIPIVYNSSGYDSVETLQLLDGIVDIYMPDMRYADAGIAQEYSGISDYPGVNRKAIVEMYRQVGDFTLDSQGVGVRGLLVRHLVLPEGLSGTEEVIGFLAENVSGSTYVSLMSQYFPAHHAPEMKKINRRVTREEYGKAKNVLMKFGFTRGWFQEME
jgi:putative pyruvate formate lyase activating enzyme